MIRINKKYYHHEFKSEINIVPFLDILLILTLTFMVIISSINQEIQVNLPEINKSNSISNDNNSKIIIEISGINKYSLIIDKYRIDQISLEEIINEVKKNVKLNLQTVFLIGGAKEIPYNEIIKVLNALKIAGARSVNLLTQCI